MFRKIILLICIAFVVVCYGYPCFVLPFGGYTYKYEDVNGDIQKVVRQFKFDGTMVDEEGEIISYYKLKGNKIIISADETIDEYDLEVSLKNMYEFEMPILLDAVEFKNDIGMYISIGVGALAIIMVLTAPNKSKRRR